MNQVKRYDMKSVIEVSDNHNGEYVLYEDYKKLQDENKELQQLELEARQLYNDVLPELNELRAKTVLELQSKLDKAMEIVEIAAMENFSRRELAFMANQLIMDVLEVKKND